QEPRPRTPRRPVRTVRPGRRAHRKGPARPGQRPVLTTPYGGHTWGRGWDHPTRGLLVRVGAGLRALAESVAECLDAGETVGDAMSLDVRGQQAPGLQQLGDRLGEVAGGEVQTLTDRSV